MEPILEAFSAEIVTSANENNLHGLYRFLARKGGKELVVEKDISWVIAKPSWPNFLFELQFESHGIESRLDQIIARIEEYAAPPVIKLGPNAKPSDLESHLERKGFEHFLSHPGMAADLMKLRIDFARPDGLSIEVVDNSESLGKWVDLAQGFEVSLYERLLSDPSIKLYLGLLNGQPVAKSLLFLSAGVAGIYVVSVLPEHRKVGIGTAMTLAPLLDARKLGFRIAILQASPLGEPIYRKMGFEEFFKLKYYRWSKISFSDFMNHKSVST
jgi:GNAT superfamily N-acetyltransferase